MCTVKAPHGIFHTVKVLYELLKNTAYFPHEEHSLYAEWIDGSYFSFVYPSI